jgi:spore germination cell wall hydrolase CwlJ-like protein
VRRHRRESSFRWICGTAAPWALGAGLLVSFTASAGQDFRLPKNAALLVETTASLATTLVPPSGLRLGATPDLPGLGLDEMVRDVGAPPDRTSQLLFGALDALPATALLPGIEAPDLSADRGFTPWQGPDPTTTRQARSVQSPTIVGAGSTGPARGAITPTADGSTPPVPRAVALSSTTPAPADATPIEIAAAPVSFPHFGLSPRLDRGTKGAPAAPEAQPGDKPNYAELVNPDNMSREQRCLAEAVYFEARSEPEEGQAAVAQVVLNRVKSGLYPSSICGVVYQNRHRHLACQFTFACEGKALRVSDAESWQSASRVAKAVLEGKTYLADVGASTHYHADYVRPRWAKRLKKMDVIGRHIFYKLRPGQT